MSRSVPFVIFTITLVFVVICLDKKAFSSNSEVLNHALSNWTITAVQWYEDNKLCANVKRLLNSAHITKIRLLESMTNETDALDENWIMLTVQELNATEDMIFRAIGCLNRILSGNLADANTLLVGSQTRLGALRAETLREEDQFNRIQKAEAARKSSILGNHSESLMGRIIKGVEKSADKLQKDLSEHAFEKAIGNPKFDGAKNVEAVIRVDDSQSGDDSSAADSSKANPNSTEIREKNSPKIQKKSKKADHHVTNLIDAHDNTYVLSKGKDSTLPMEDTRFIKDLVCIIITATILGGLCQLLGLPSLFGHVLAGIILGPSTLAFLNSVVQLESIGLFGVYLILFTVGLEFSPRKVRPLLKVATFASLLPMLVMIALCILIGRLMTPASTTESAFVGACLSFSSTPLIVNFLDEDKRDTGGMSEFGRVLLSILILQDIYLALLMAIMPATAIAFHTIDSNTADLVAVYAIQIVRLSVTLGCMLATVCVFHYLVARPLVHYSQRLGGREALLLCILTCALGGMMLAQKLHVSGELGSFLVGVVFSGLSHKELDQVEGVIIPLRDFLALIFFVSIGLHVFPKFLLYEVAVLSVVTLSVVACKFFLSALMLHLFLPKTSGTIHNGDDNDRRSTPGNLRRYKWLVSAGLAQVSEFSFVLGSIARKLGLCTRETYLLILGVTTLSLLLAPLPWKIILWWTRGMPTTSLQMMCIQCASRGEESPNIFIRCCRFCFRCCTPTEDKIKRNPNSSDSQPFIPYETELIE